MTGQGSRVLGSQAEYGHVASILCEVAARSGVPDTRAHSVHSMKVTMLAWSGQVVASSGEQRKHRGHHKLDMTDIYARDDTLGAPCSQLHVLEALAEGRRPCLAQERGALQPVPEPLGPQTTGFLITEPTGALGDLHRGHILGRNRRKTATWDISPGAKPLAHKSEQYH